MRWGVVVVGLLIGSVGLCSYAMSGELSQDTELTQAIDRMHGNGMTKYETVVDFRPTDFLTRQEAAKFFSEFAINILYKDIDQNKFCGFDDIDNADPSLKNHILSSCLLGLFQGTAGYFKPNDQLTKAQALAVLVRSVNGYSNEETIPRRINYFRKAQELKLTNEADPYALDRPLQRYEIALLLYRAGKDSQLGTGQIASDSGNTSGVEVVKVDELIKTGGGD